ncbi:RyR domain-containing protein [uncultured Bacteroides sp.]|uniref:RyR domain-containing protein n=1 Tax=uncultured Bacteroides sp. TaxID=162156 RepID=UPI0025CE1A9D|nr:RyR domain-containing protein [uncultured Bacteroides sp.]
MEQDYTPSPLNTTDISLPESLANLTEAMARNVHEVWASGRLKEGWKYGTTRNDEMKTHPCLVSYEDLPEAEREYDRQTAIQTLKLIMKLGYKITK